MLVGTIVVLLLAHRDEVSGPNPLPPGETGFLILASATGALVLAAAGDLATIVVALEVVSLPAFALVGLRRRDPRGAEAALTFFLVSVVSVAVMLYGVSLVYGATGSLHLDRIASVLADPASRTSVATAGVVLIGGWRSRSGRCRSTSGFRTPMRAHQWWLPRSSRWCPRRRASSGSSLSSGKVFPPTRTCGAQPSPWSRWPR